jgi:hypothetical protein
MRPQVILRQVTSSTIFSAQASDTMGTREGGRNSVTGSNCVASFSSLVSLNDAIWCLSPNFKGPALRRCLGARFSRRALPGNGPISQPHPEPDGGAYRAAGAAACCTIIQSS